MINKDTIKKFLPISIILLLIISAWLLGLNELINLDSIKSQRSELLELVNARPVLSASAFVAIYIISVALSLPIATVLTLLGGFLFGRWLGTFLIVFSATAGATILFIAAKSAIGSTLRDKAGPLFQKIEANMNQNAIGYLLFMRLVPLFPFFLVNIVPALFNIRLLPYIATTFIGIMPGTFVYANVGRELGTIESLSDLISTEMILAFTLLGLFALLPTILKQAKIININQNNETNN
ncbi:MAG: TVP38/TMEM64 family protein [Gammaproteobacteria bacterium]|nr:TVP38/TMEM64 family protein [Gammaproteobacteria bacterium]